MCNDNKQPRPQDVKSPSEEEKMPIDKELQMANLNLQLVQTRSNAEYNASVAGQMQRQFESMQRCAKPYAESTIVPSSYRGNIGNCIIALDIAFRMGLNALTVMQNLYIVNGNPSWASKFLIATVNTCGRFTNIRYKKRIIGKLGKVMYNALEYDPEKKRQTTVVKEFDATGIDNWECVAYATEKATGELLESDPVTIEMAIKEGWYTKNGSKWVTMPMLMLSYRAAAFWQRVYAPEISMGFRTVEEENDAIYTEYEEIPAENDAPEEKAPTSASVEEAKEKLRNRDTSGKKKSATPRMGTGMFGMP